MKTRRYYFHIVDSHPGAFSGDQICFLQRQRRNIKKSEMVKSLATIRRQQQKTFRFREFHGYSCDRSKYGYVCVRLPE